MQPARVRQRQGLPNLVQVSRGADLDSLPVDHEQLVAPVSIHVGGGHAHRALRELRPVARHLQDGALVRAEATVAVPVDLYLVAAGEDHLLPAVAVEIGQLHLHGVMGGQPERRLYREAAAAAAVDERVGVVLEARAVVGHHQLQLAVAVQVLAGYGQGGDPGDGEPFGGVLEHAWPGLQIDVQRARRAGIVMVHPSRWQDQVQQPVAGQVDGGHVVGAGGGQLGTRAGQTVRAAPVDVAIELRGDPVLGVDHDQVEEPIAVQVRGMTHPAAVVGQLAPAPLRAGSRRLGVDPGGAAFVVAVGVGKYQVDVAVAVHVGAVDPLDGAGAGHVEVVAAVVELALPERGESAVPPAPVRLRHRGQGMRRASPREPERGFEPLTCSLRVNRSAN